MLKLMKAKNMTPATAAPATTAAPISDFQDAAHVRWLSRTLAPARAQVLAAPATEAVDRIRARLFGAPARVRKAKAA